MTKRYRVTWVTEVQADNYRGAAVQALQVQRNGGTSSADMAFHVQTISDDGGVYDDGCMIGLSDDAPAPLVLSVAWLVGGRPSDDAP